MTILNIVKYPNELLHQKSEPIKVSDKRLKKLVNDMFETMYKYDGIGLAAVQVGVLQNIIVIDIDYENQKFKSEIINLVSKGFPSSNSFAIRSSSSVLNTVQNWFRA